MTNFENDLTNLLEINKFRAAKRFFSANFFQQQLAEGIGTIKNTKTTLTFANKTSNANKFPKEQYKKLVNNVITTS